jgi:glycosyltransferase involved in cell wall biosynthesis
LDYSQRIPKVAIDISRISSHRTGIEYYAYELARVLLQSSEIDLHLVTNSPEYTGDLLQSSEANRAIIVNSEKNNFSWMRKVSRKLRENKIDILISPSNFGFSLLFRPTYQIVNDLAPIFYPMQVGIKVSIKFYIFLFLASVFARKLPCISETTRRSLINHFPWARWKSFNIGGGVNEWTDKLTTTDDINLAKKVLNLPDKYLLSVSTLQPRKNYENMIRAFNLFLKDYPNYKYVIVGKKGWKYESIFNLVKELKLEDKVIFLDYVDEKYLSIIYKDSSVFLFCSLFEGLGMPAVEAYKMGVPVVTSDIPVMRETMENKAIYANPRNIDSIVEAIKSAINLKSTPDQTFLEERSWEKVGERVVRVIQYSYY